MYHESFLNYYIRWLATVRSAVVAHQAVLAEFVLVNCLYVYALDHLYSLKFITIPQTDGTRSTTHRVVPVTSVTYARPIVLLGVPGCCCPALTWNDCFPLIFLQTMQFRVIFLTSFLWIQNLSLTCASVPSVPRCPFSLRFRTII